MNNQQLHPSVQLVRSEIESLRQIVIVNPDHLTPQEIQNRLENLLADLHSVTNCLIDVITDFRIMIALNLRDQYAEIIKETR